MTASIDEIIKLTAHIIERLKRDYAVPEYIYDEPWFAARIHTYADRGTDVATATFLIANRAGGGS